MGNRSIHRMMLIAAASVTGLVGLAAAAEAPQAITIQLFQFRPGQVDVPKGSRITWTNQDDITHTVTSGTPEKRDGRFSAQLAGKGATATSRSWSPARSPTSASGTLRWRRDRRALTPARTDNAHPKRSQT